MWTSDLHLDACKDWVRRDLYDKIKQSEYNVLVVCGDIANGVVNSMRYIRELHDQTGKKIMFVLGNHDCYGSSVKTSRRYASDFDFNGAPCVFMKPDTIYTFGRNACIVGHSGWYDGTAGMLDDKHTIIDCARVAELVNTDDMGRTLAQLGGVGLYRLEKTLQYAMSEYKHVVLATHVPPLWQCARYQGKPTGTFMAPFFCAPKLGKVLTKVCCNSEGLGTIHVLCGHTHSECRDEFLNGFMTVNVFGADYGSPQVEEWQLK